MKRVIMLDSDDENEEEEEVKRPSTSFASLSNKSSSVGHKSENPPEKVMKLTTADDFFGSSVVVKQAKKPIDEFRNQKANGGKQWKEKEMNVPQDVSSDQFVKKDKEESGKVELDVKSHIDPTFRETLTQLDNDPFLSLKYNNAQTHLVSPSKKLKCDSKRGTVEKVGENKSPPQTTDVACAVAKQQKHTSPSKSLKQSPNEVSTPKKLDLKKSTETVSPAKTSSPMGGGTTSETPKRDTNQESSTIKLQKSSSKASYWSYQNRQGPQFVGSKTLPRGPDDCLAGKTFVLTGVLECFEREDIKSFIERHSGKVVTSVSSKTCFIVVGREPGESKVTKAQKLGTTCLNEDELLEVVAKHVKCSSPKACDVSSLEEAAAPADRKGRRSSEDVGQTEKESTSQKSHREKVQLSSTPTTKLEKSPETAVKRLNTCVSKPPPTTTPTPVVSNSDVDLKTETPKKTSQTHSCEASKDSLLWVDKYQAKSMKQIIGQNGEKSNAKKLHFWLQHWHAVFTHKSGPMASKDNGLAFRSALLSGVAGIGKTTTATIVCKELGFEMISMNASDTRSQKLLNNVVSESLKSGTLTSLMTSAAGKSQGGSSTGGGDKDADLKHVLIMDEVDGMAGNEDRGGMAELIGLIRKSKIPVICICNDRQHQKVRSLANYCFDLRFQRPRVEQLKSAMMSICFKEGLKVLPNALEQLIIGANQDVRQVIHHLQAWFCMQKPVSYDSAKQKATSAKKDQKMGPFDACKAAFAYGEERRKLSIHDKLDYFFYDYSMMPLFMQENYLHTSMNRGSAKSTLEAISNAADSLASGDIASKIIRSTNNWSLLPKVGMFSCVIPGELCQGSLNPFVTFPQWLGQNSKKNKNERLLQDLQVHTRLHLNTSKYDLNMQLMPMLRHKFIDCLHSANENGIECGVNLLLELELTRDDLDTIFCLSQMSEVDDPWRRVSTKDKSTFTRLYNKQSHKVPHHLAATSSSGAKKRKAADITAGLLGAQDEDNQASGSNEANEEEEDDNEKDDDFIPGLIAKKVPRKNAHGPSTSSAKTNKNNPSAKGSRASNKTTSCNVPSSKKTVTKKNTSR